ncbi:MAG TPA: hypothetical protein VMI94_05240 [Bryobacteraceae bacterium]|nr:hypothetical protein [Bryobacteraceae bacterium]
MKQLLLYGRIALLALAITPLVAPQSSPSRRTPHAEDIPFTNDKQQQDEILKADHERDLKDAAQLIELAEELKKELEKNDRHVLSISSIKKTEEIEKLAKRIRGRIVR